MRKNKFLPIIIINYLNKTGSSSSIENIKKESDLIQEYNLKSFQKNSVSFDEEDLKRLNSKYLKSLSLDELKKTMRYPMMKIWNTLEKTLDNLDEVDEWFKILSQNHDTKLKIDPKLLEVIEMKLPVKIDLNTWEKLDEENFGKFQNKTERFVYEHKSFTYGEKIWTKYE